MKAIDIEYRIREEQKKHGRTEELDWIKIASQKIASTLKHESEEQAKEIEQLKKANGTQMKIISGQANTITQLKKENENLTNG